MCSTISKYILFFVNLVIIIAGALITAVGALLQFGGDFFKTYIMGSLEMLTRASGVPGPSDTSLTFEKVTSLFGQYAKYLDSASLVIFILGLVLLIIGVCGGCGAMTETKVLLVIYMIAVGIILAGMLAITLLIFFKKKDFQDEAEKFFRQFIKEKFVGLQATKPNAESAILSLVMARLECCGINNSSDFDENKAPKWQRTYQHKDGYNITMKIPLACCKMKLDSYEPKYFKCLTEPNSTNSNMENGCFTLLWGYVDKYTYYVELGLAGTCGFLLFLIICAASIACKSSSSKVVPA